MPPTKNSPKASQEGTVIAKALEGLFSSPNESDSNGEEANVVDGLFAIARGLHDIADAIRESGNESREEDD
jgi:hypothetical protein